MDLSKIDKNTKKGVRDKVVGGTKQAKMKAAKPSWTMAAEKPSNGKNKWEDEEAWHTRFESER